MPTQKRCSICGKNFASNHYSYGNRDNRSYCIKCNKEEITARTKGGTVAAREFRDKLRAMWKT